MNAFEFHKQPRGPFLFDFYKHPVSIPSPLGEFTVELQMAVGDTGPPDQAMIDTADDLVTQFTADEDRITKLVFEQYKTVSDEPDWLDECEIPLGLATDELGPYLHACTLSIRRDLDNRNEPYSARVHMLPQWDEEHGLYFKRGGDGWIRVDC